MRGRLMEGLEPVSLCCASGVFTKDLEDALFDIWIRPANVKRYSIGHNVNSTFDIGLLAKPLNVELASEAFVAICLLRY